MSRLSKINDLAFELVHEVMEPSEQFSYAKQIYDLSEEPELSENQLVVLDWLKSDDHPNYSNIFDLFSDLLEYQVPTKVGEAFTEMMTDKKQQIQVLQAFSCWAIEQEEA
ncbi:hypothetical protein N2D08_13195 [Enterococcus faecalis]|uniref:hypothetical protein n=1 Tax=Enterococcus faecalis TaxID=1351 RepID=UPI0021C62C6C|nr:hypothetical protein [Enterococcus faecalis]MCU2270295.1 hypothetical protein [Enterococcus faecalis]